MSSMTSRLAASAVAAPVTPATASGLKPGAGYRNRLDRLVFGGWVLLLVVGQAALPFRNEAFERLAMGWLLAGMAVVRPAACLPLLVMTCPAFMCDAGNVNAWWQEMAAIVFLLRVVAACRHDGSALLRICLAAAAVLFLSWPADSGPVWQGIRERRAAEVLGHLAGAQASWYIFPIRQSLERSLAAAICAGVVCRPEFLSSWRVWCAAFASSVLAALATFGHMLLPWQEPHVFLGTTNHARLAGLLFHGAGYNLSYFAILLAVGIPWFVVAAMTRGRRRFAGLGGLLWPAFYVIQIAFYAAVSATMLAFSGAAARAGPARLRAGARPGRPGLLRSAGPLFAVASALSLLYMAKLREVVGTAAVLDATRLALCRFVPVALLVLAAAVALLAPVLAALHFAAELIGKLRGRAGAWFRPALSLCLLILFGCSAFRLFVPAGPAEQPCGARSRAADRVVAWLERVEPARADMWELGARKIRGEYIVRGSGAGTWARFHRRSERKTRLYYAHMHNTYLDAAFEYGAAPAAAAFICVLLAALRIAASRAFSRLWLLYFIPCLVMALGQHLLYSFTSICLLMPVAIVTARVLAKPAPANVSVFANATT